MATVQICQHRPLLLDFSRPGNQKTDLADSSVYRKLQKTASFSQRKLDEVFVPKIPVNSDCSKRNIDKFVAQVVVVYFLFIST